MAMTEEERTDPNAVCLITQDTHYSLLQAKAFVHIMNKIIGSIKLFLKCPQEILSPLN